MARFALTHPRETEVSNFNHDLCKSYLLNDFDIRKDLITGKALEEVHKLINLLNIKEVNYDTTIF